MPTTSRGYPYPGASSADNVPLDMSNLASAINDDVDTLAARNAVAAGGAIVTLAGTTAATLTVPLPAGRFTSAPSVTCNVEALVSATRNYLARAINLTATSFTIYLIYTDGATLPSSGSVTVEWTAVARG